MYCSANLTTSRLTSGITGVSDLPGKAVGTWTEYQETLTRYSIQAKGYPWEGIEDGNEMIAVVRAAFLLKN